MAGARVVEPLVERPRLLARLDARSPVTVLRAPVGFGKTTLVGQWARQQRRHGHSTGETSDETLVWARVRAGCGDTATFWAGLVDALTDTGFPLPPLAGHRSPQSVAERMLGTADRPLLLVADGFENVTAADADQRLVELARDTPNLRLIVCLRSHRHFPAEAIAELPATLLDARALRFTVEETAQLCTAAGLDVPTSCAQTIHATTGGWPEPTRTCVVTLREMPPDPGDFPDVAAGIALDYLRHHLLPEATRPDRVEFALLTALADEFTLALAETLTDTTTAKAHVEWLENEGVLFAQMRDGETVYQWPDAARAALREEARYRLAGRLPELHSRLARWRLDGGQPETALRHAVQARNWQLVITIIESSWRQLLFAHPGPLFEAFTATPLEVIATSRRAVALRDLRLRVPDDLLLTMTPLPASATELSELAAGEHAADIIDAGLIEIAALRRRGLFSHALTHGDRMRDLAEHVRSLHPAEVLADYPAVQMNAGLNRLLTGDLAGALGPLRIAHEFAADNPRAYIESDAASKSALAHAVLGEPQRARHWLDHYRAAPLGNTWLAPMIRVTAAAARVLLALDHLDHDQAAAACQALPTPPRTEEFWAYILYAQAQHALNTGGHVDILDQLDRARAAYRHWLNHGAIADPLLAAAEVNLLLATGRGNEAHAVLRGPHAGHPLLQVGAARLALLSGDHNTARQLADDRAWERVATSRDRAEMLLIQAIAAHRATDTTTATVALSQAVSTARDTGALRSFTTVARDELATLARDVPTAAELLTDPRLLEAPDLYPTSITLILLTDRERDVLEKLAEGLTVEQAAENLVVSYNTVKSHTRSLYRKLGADGRRDALTRARRWGLLRR